jgi:transposase
MQDKELYQHLLGLTAPWPLSEVKLDMQSQEIHVKAEPPRGTKFCCPDCQKQLPRYDHGEERQWRHLDSCQFKTILKERIDNIVTYCTHGITNGVGEGINSKIMSIKRRAGGDRNIENFRKRFFLLRRTKSLPKVTPDETFFRCC